MDKLIIAFALLMTFPVSICTAEEPTADTLADESLMTPQSDDVVKDFVELSGVLEEGEKETKKEEKKYTHEEAVRLLFADPTKANEYAQFLNPNVLIGSNGAYAPPDPTGALNGAKHIAPQMIVDAPAPVVTPESLGLPSPAESARPDYAGSDWVQSRPGGDWIAPLKE